MTHGSYGPAQRHDRLPDNVPGSFAINNLAPTVLEKTIARPTAPDYWARRGFQAIPAADGIHVGRLVPLAPRED